MRLLSPLALGGRTARNRVLFGPHETNLARGRAVSDRHVAYYAARAAGGAGVIVVEEASVHRSDWPYERCPLASECGPGWSAVASACHAEGALVLAALGHAGGQGSSAYSQAPLWAPSRVPEVNTREVPKWMEPDDIAAVVAGFRQAATLAMRSGLDGVEVNAGQHSLVRQFLSGLTNQRDDAWGHDRMRFARDTLAAVRDGAGADAVVGLRLCCDELAPWAGIVPEAAVEIAVGLAQYVDYVTVVRGSIFSVAATRPDTHTPPGFNLATAAMIRAALPAAVAVVAQGSIVDVVDAEAALADGVADAVEMTRAQIADPALASKAAEDPHRIRPCILCNQTCQVRDPRNPIVSCVVEPSAGHESEEACLPDGTDPTPRPPLLVVGAGPAGLECARVAALSGRAVTLRTDADRLGGMVRTAATGAGRARLSAFVDWLERECDLLGVEVRTGHRVDADEALGFAGDVVLCTGSQPGRATYEVEEGAIVISAADALGGDGRGGDGLGGDGLGGEEEALRGPVAIWDPIGGPIGVSVAETLRARGLDVALVTPDLIAGNELSRTGDLAPASVRLLAAGVVIEKRSILRRATRTGAVVEDRFTGMERVVPAAFVVDAGHRLPSDGLWRATQLPRAGDAVAPRGIYEAVLEGRRRALEPTRDAVRA